MFWKSQKDFVPSLLHIETEEEKKDCEAWMKELGVSRCYTQFAPIEDPNLVQDATAVTLQIKIDKIKAYHRQFQRSIKED